MSIQLIQRYYASIDELIRHGGSINERTIRRPFEVLLGTYAKSKNLLLVSEIELYVKGNHRIIPDGVLDQPPVIVPLPELEFPVCINAL